MSYPWEELSREQEEYYERIERERVCSNCEEPLEGQFNNGDHEDSTECAECRAAGLADAAADVRYDSWVDDGRHGE